MTKTDELRELFKNVEEDKQKFAYDTIEDYVFFSEKIAELKKLPLIRVSKSNPERQELTPAAKLIKDYSNVVDAKRKILLMILYRVENSAADDLLAKLSEFE